MVSKSMEYKTVLKIKIRLVGASLRRIGLSMQQQAIKASAPAP